jgi:hypothetical protein
MKKIIIAALFAATSTGALADSVIVTDTKDWRPVPITVEGDVYTTTEIEPTSGDFYYSYAGHRCFKTVSPKYKDPQTLTVKGGTTKIYCYPE